MDEIESCGSGQTQTVEFVPPEENDFHKAVATSINNKQMPVPWISDIVRCETM